MAGQSGQHTHALTIVHNGNTTHARERWEAIAAAWRDLSPDPKLHFCNIDEACERLTETLGSAVLILADENASSGNTLFSLLDHLWEQCLPAVLLVEERNDRTERLGGRGTIVLDRSSAAPVVASSLFALAERQGFVRSIQTELRIASRFQGGLRGEMDKIHEELQLAASVQREFLPDSLPQVDNIDFRVFFRPAGYVSGDIYDVQRLDEHHVGFFLADAVGHGVPAALMTMVLSRSLTMKVVSGDSYDLLEPTEVMQRLNREMIRRHGDVPRFATAVYGVVDTRDRSIRLTGAGHPPPLIIGPEGTRPIETEGGLLGVFPDDDFPQVEFSLRPDESLLIYSDGFETAFPEPGSDEYERKMPTTRYLSAFDDLATEIRSIGPQQAMERFAELVNAQDGSLHQVDDITVMSLFATSDSPVDQLFRGIAGRNASTPGQKQQQTRRV
ncbi:MAG: PP2C family protein-serine/threonine phosphatase [Phycisphaerales bacterium JB050]